MRLNVAGERFVRRARVDRYGAVVGVWVVLVAVGGAAAAEVFRPYLSGLPLVCSVFGVVVVLGAVPGLWLRQGFEVCGEKLIVQNSFRRYSVEPGDLEFIKLGSTSLPIPVVNTAPIVWLSTRAGRLVSVGATAGLGRRSARDAFELLSGWAEAWGVPCDVDLEELVFFKK